MISTGCGTPDAVDANVNLNSNTNAEADELKAELTALKNADFDYIYSFRRKDGEPMDSVDKRFVKDNSHSATNRFTLTRDEKVIFAGSNYKFSDEGLKALRERFDLEDFSKPEAVLEQKRKKDEAAAAGSNKSGGNSAKTQKQN